MTIPFATVWARYAAAAAFVLLFVGIRWLLHPLLGDNAQLLLFILPIIVAALVGNFLTGVFAAVVSALIGNYFFIRPYYSLEVENPADFFHILSFAVIGVILSWLVEQLHRARAHAEAKAIEARIEAEESRVAEEYARESEERFRHVADAAPVMIWVSDKSKNCVWFNQPWLDFTGRTMEEELANTRENAIHPDDFQNCTDIYFSAFARRESYTMEYRLSGRDGEYCWILDNGVPRFSPNGEFLGFIGSCVDIDERKKAEAERELLLEETKHAHAQAEIANRLKDEFIGTVSHELRTPLNAILGWTQMMRSGIVGGEQQTRAVEVIERNAKSQAQLIEDLLDVTRIASGKLRLNVQTLDLAQVLASAIDTTRPAAEAKEIEIVKIFDPQAEAVSGDPERLQQVVWNLLSNAVKFTPRGGRVEVELKKSGAFVEIAVSDTGRGIEPEFLPYVFDRFRQAEQTTTRKHGGLGLGLAIVRNLVELHGGTIRAESAGAERGATFIVRLPTRAVTDGKRTPTGSYEQIIPAVGFMGAPDLSIDLHGIKIVVVDDERDARDLLTSLLTVYGADVTTCESAAQVLEVLPTVKPQLLISDIGMPQMDGYDLIKQIREMPADSGGQVPAIALTAFTRVEDRVRALSQGFQMFVPKPVEPSELVAAVKSLSGLESVPKIDESHRNGSSDD